MDPVFSYCSPTMTPMDTPVSPLFDSITSTHPTYSSTKAPVKNKQAHLYKTEHCRNWNELGECRYGQKCCYAHGDSELRSKSRHSRYKTQICRAYHRDGTCPYGRRCTFIHDNDTQTRPPSSATQDQQVPAGLQHGQIWHSKLGLRLDHSFSMQGLSDLSSDLTNGWSRSLKPMDQPIDGDGSYNLGSSSMDHQPHTVPSYYSFMNPPL